MKDELRVSPGLPRALPDLLCSHISWVLALSAALLALDLEESTLFGLAPRETIAATLAFAPAEPFRLHGLPLLAFSFVHADLTHWLSSAFFFAVFAWHLRDRLSGGGLLRELALFLALLGGAAWIALSYLQPWAPAASPGDRVLGLSGLALAMLGASLALRPPLFLYLVALAAAFAFLRLDPGSPLAQWGHGVGFASGLLSGLLLRFGFPRATAAFAARPSYPRGSSHRRKGPPGRSS